MPDFPRKGRVIYLINPRPGVSFGIGVIAPRWLRAGVRDTARARRAEAIDETLETFDPSVLKPGDIVGSASTRATPCAVTRSAGRRARPAHRLSSAASTPRSIPTKLSISAAATRSPRRGRRRCATTTPRWRSISGRISRAGSTPRCLTAGRRHAAVPCAGALDMSTKTQSALFALALPLFSASTSSFRTWQPGADVEELPDAVLGEPPHRTLEEPPVRPGRVLQFRHLFADRLRRLAVDLVVVLAAQVVVVHPGRTRDRDVHTWWSLLDLAHRSPPSPQLVMHEL